MVELLAEVRGDETIKTRFLPQLRREYEYWMSGANTLSRDHPADRHVVGIHDGFANRFWDDATIPRQESYAEDVELAANTSRNAENLYRDVRAAAESGWDFSSRWLADPHSLATIRTTNVIPVDLNSLMYKLETTIAEISAAAGEQSEANHYFERAKKRRQLIQTLFFDEASGMFVDIVHSDLRPTATLSLAAAYPLFFGIATPEQGARVAQRIHRDFLRAGGWLVTQEESGQQWDSPNGWAPMQWITYCGLERYGFHKEARIGAMRWVETNMTAYKEHGRLLEKYDVTANGLAGVGGEYAVQDGFGWTNAILLRLMRKLGKSP